MIRSLLFAPANRRELLLKFPRVPADCYVIDLEDGTPPRDKAAARAALPSVVAELRGHSLRGLLYVRLNEVSSPHYADDLSAALACDLDGVVLPKIEHASEAVSLARVLASKGAGRRMNILGGVESIQGVLNVESFAGADERLIAFYFGAEDFAAEMGIDRTLGGEEVAYVRARIALAARAHRKPVIDQAVPQIRDLDQFRRDSEKGKGLGYSGKICVTPQQVGLANSIFAPTVEEVNYAKRLLAAYQAGIDAGNEMITFEDKMIVPEGPHVKRARRIVESALQFGIGS